MVFFVILAVWTALAISQNTSQLPSCAQGCLANATGHQGSCSNVDLKCLCSNIGYINVLACCLSTKCSSEDQRKAVAFNSQLCSGVNVTIPNFLGCAAITTSGSSSKTSKTDSSSSVQTGTPTSSLLTADKIGPAVSIPTSAPLAKFTGGSLLTGSCSIPQFASVTVNPGGITEYPWLGCSYQKPGCCPFDINVGGSLTVCPADYITTSSACCPSGWSIYTESFVGGQTPCYTNPPQDVIPPSTATSTSNVSINILNDQIFTLKYGLQPKSTLTSGAKAGIGIGVSAAAVAAVAALFIILRRRRTPPTGRRFSLVTGEGTPGDKHNSSSFSPNVAPPPPNISELPSPVLANPPVLTPPVPAAPPAEMPGDTFLNQHHPAYSSEHRTEEALQIPPQLRIGEGSISPAEVVSPLEGPARS